MTNGKAGYGGWGMGASSETPWIRNRSYCFLVSFGARQAWRASWRTWGVKGFSRM